MCTCCVEYEYVQYQNHETIKHRIPNIESSVVNANSSRIEAPDESPGQGLSFRH